MTRSIQHVFVSLVKMVKWLASSSLRKRYKLPKKLALIW